MNKFILIFFIFFDISFCLILVKNNLHQDNIVYSFLKYEFSQKKILGWCNYFISLFKQKENLL